MCNAKFVLISVETWPYAERSELCIGHLIVLDIFSFGGGVNEKPQCSNAVLVFLVFRHLF